MRPEESLDKMIASLREKTGKSLDEWREIIAAWGLTKHSEVVAKLKADHGLTHGFAHQISLRREASVSEESADPMAETFAKRPEAKAVYDELWPKIKAFGADVDVAPKKGYLSIRRSKQFAILQPAAGRLDVGIQLKGEEPAGRLEASGSFNAMLSHRVRVATPQEVDRELIGWLQTAYERA